MKNTFSCEWRSSILSLYNHFLYLSLCNASRSSTSTRSNSLFLLLSSSSIWSSPSSSESLSELLSLSELADSDEDEDDSDELESEDLLLSVLDEMGESLDDSSSDSPRRWKHDCGTRIYKHTSCLN